MLILVTVQTDIRRNENNQSELANEGFKTSTRPVDFQVPNPKPIQNVQRLGKAALIDSSYNLWHLLYKMSCLDTVLFIPSKVQFNLSVT